MNIDSVELKKSYPNLSQAALKSPVLAQRLPQYDSRELEYLENYLKSEIGTEIARGNRLPKANRQDKDVSDVKLKGRRVEAYGRELHPSM